MEHSLFYVLPVWFVGLMFFVVLLVALELGYRIGLVRRVAWKDAEAGGGGIVLTSLFAVLGLVLAFTYAAGVARFDARKQAVVDEANALGTAFLRADVVAEPGRTELKRALYEYALTRSIPAATAVTVEDQKAVVERTLQKQAQLWPATRKVIEQNNAEPLEVSVIAAMNGVFDAHTVRMAAVLDHLPGTVMWLLLLVASAALTVAGYNAGLQGRMSRWRMSAFTIVLTAIALVVLDFDRPNDGTVVVNQQSIDAVIAEMQADLEK
jgi:hypothetical protein